MNKIIFLISIFIIALASQAFAAPEAGRAASPVKQRFDLKFSPPLLEVSQFNSKKELLAVQLKEGGSEPEKIIAIDRRGRVRVIEDLEETGEITVPGQRLWIAGIRSGEAGSTALPVLKRRVWLAPSGESYAVAYFASGSWYELRYKDKGGKLLFIAGPKDVNGLNNVIISGDGSRVLLDDETAPYSMTRPGQRLYLYDRDGKLLMDRDAGGNLEAWLEVSGGFMAQDGSYFVAPRGMGKKKCASILLIDGGGKDRWERSYFPQHALEEDIGGLFRVRGGSRSFINFIDTAGELRAVERKGYGFELKLSRDFKKSYMLMFKPFDAEKSGLPEEIKTVFPGTEVLAVNIPELWESANPAAAQAAGTPAMAGVKVELAPDGQSFICYACRADMGASRTRLVLFGADKEPLWKDQFYQTDIVPQFTGDREFLLKFGYPITRLLFCSP